MTNFKMNLHLSGVFVLAFAFCCLAIGQAAAANNSNSGQKTHTPPNPRADTPTTVHELGTTPPPEVYRPAVTVSNRVEVTTKPASASRPNVERGDKQGGELISNATVIPGLPYSDAGATDGYADDYNEACPYTATGGPDVVYSYTPAADETVILSLCGSSYDTKLYVYDTDPPTVGAPVACNDDNDAVCGPGTYRSYIDRVDLTAGTTYYFVVDGYDIDSYGAYLFEIPMCGGCGQVTQPEGAALEGEPCTGDLDDPPVDNVNGGCNSSPAVFGNIALDGSVFGETWSNETTGYRDTDWYLFTITEPMTVTLKGISEAPFSLLLVTGDFTTCTGIAVAASVTGAVPFDTITTSAVLMPGAYVAWVGGTGELDNLCASGPWNYAVWLTGVPYVPIEGQDCAAPIVVNYTGLYEDLGQTTCGMIDNYNATMLGNYDGGEDIIYQINVTEAHEVKITLDPLGTAYTGFMLTTDCPGMSGLVAGKTNSGATAYSACANLDPGTYYLMIDTYPDPTCIPSFNLTIVDTTCAPPPNDDCANAMVITNGSYTGDNTMAAGDGPHPTQNNLWYCYTATCTGVATAGMCASPDNSLDLRLYVYDGCTCPTAGTEIAAGDDQCVAPAHGTPEVEFPVVAGQQYLIEVGNYIGELGPFNLTLSCEECTINPANNDCMNADHQVLISGVPAVFTGTTYCASNDCPDLDNGPEVWISFTLTDGCSNLKLSYCAGYEGGPGWSVWAHILDACPCDDGGYNYTTYTFTCSDASQNFSMTIDSVPAGTYWYPVNQNNEGGGYEYVITVEAVECPPYCAVGSTCDEYISRVAVGTIDNSNGVCTAGGYKDYTDDFTTTMYKGVSYPITVITGAGWEEDRVKGWADYNLDFLFDDASGSNEIIEFYGNPGLGPFAATITPPATAVTGETTLRVRLRWNLIPFPCTVIGYGETEDYALIIQDLPCGDVNMDGNCDIADIDYLIAYYSAGGAPPLPISANGDANGDCCINLADIVYLADYIFRAGANPICLPCNP